MTGGRARRLCYVERVEGARLLEGSSEIVCPHCKKRFEGKLISGSPARYRGFKCPHCKLFVPFERAVEPR